MPAWEVVLYKYHNLGGTDGTLIEPQSRERVAFYAHPDKNLIDVTGAALKKCAAEGLHFRSITFRRTIDPPGALPVAPALPEGTTAVLAELQAAIANVKLLPEGGNLIALPVNGSHVKVVPKALPVEASPSSDGGEAEAVAIEAAQS